jgi:hypothetical protein
MMDEIVWTELLAQWGMGLGLVLVCLLAWALNLIALPGNWLAVALIGGYAWLGPDEGRLAIGWPIVATCFALAALGELWEFAAGAFGARRAGGSRRSTLFAVLGSIAGAILGAVVGVPVPIFGSIIAALLFGALGATAGAIYGEWSDGKDWRESWTVGQAAFWGRLLGTAGKFVGGLGIVLLVVVGVLF